MNWTRTCNKFKRVRKAIEEDNSMEIINLLKEICQTYSKANWLFADDFKNLKEDLELLDEEDIDDEGNVNYYLEEFYDLCDAARVWLPIE